MAIECKGSHEGRVLRATAIPWNCLTMTQIYGPMNMLHLVFVLWPWSFRAVPMLRTSGFHNFP